jgi:hypothetical protein
VSSARPASPGASGVTGSGAKGSGVKGSDMSSACQIGLRR